MAFHPEEIGKMIDGLCSFADHQQVFFECRPFLADHDDDLVLELVVAISASFVITHNPPDFRGSNSRGGDGWIRGEGGMGDG